MPKKKGGTSVAVPSTPFTRFQAALRVWLDSRKRSIGIIEKYMALRSQATYVTASQVSASIGSALSASRLNVQVEAELYGQLMQLETNQNTMLQSIQDMGAILIGMNTSSDATLAAKPAGPWPLDEAFTSKLLEDMKQQSLLEVSVYETLRQEQQHTANQADHDAAVTWTACFTFPPYLNLDTAESVLEIRE